MSLIPIEVELITGIHIIAVEDEQTGERFRLVPLSKYYTGYEENELSQKILNGIYDRMLYNNKE